MRSPPLNYGPVGFATTATIRRPTIGQTSTYAPDYLSTEVDEDNVPCTIQTASASEQIKIGDGRAREGTRVYTAYMPARKADGSERVVESEALVVADGTTYDVISGSQPYADGLIRLSLEVKR